MSFSCVFRVDGFLSPSEEEDGEGGFHFLVPASLAKRRRRSDRCGHILAGRRAPRKALLSSPGCMYTHRFLNACAGNSLLYETTRERSTCSVFVCGCCLCMYTLFFGCSLSSGLESNAVTRFAALSLNLVAGSWHIEMKERHYKVRKKERRKEEKREASSLFSR